jgi:acyl-CoA thioester hydrolase
LREPAPFESRSRVRSEWIDMNGHMNVAYYVLAFDQATDAFNEHIGIGPSYTGSSGHSVFAVGMNVDYAREVFEDDPLRISTQLLDWDAKHLQLFHHMYHAERGFLAGTNEVLLVHVSLSARRSVPFPDAVQARLAEVAQAHARLGIPPAASRRLEIARKRETPATPTLSGRTGA